MADREEEFRSLLRLSGIKGFGPHRVAGLIDHFGCARAVLGASVPALSASRLITPTGAAAIHQARTASVSAPLIRRFRHPEPGERISLISDPDYPALLRRTSQPPLWLWMRGPLVLADQPCVAMVGSRDATRRGADVTRAWSYRLASAGITVVSGMAKGIDTAAHQGALDAGGSTIAVMGTGMDRVYPSANRSLASEIASSGLLMTEFHPGVGARAHHFPQRNRIIAGLCHATLVMEAAQESGSLITARMAQDEGREVGLVPGRPGDRNAAGSNLGIRENVGELVMEVDDVLTMLSRIPGLDWRPPVHESVVRSSSERDYSSDESTRRKPVRRDSPEGRVRTVLEEQSSTLDAIHHATGLSRESLEETLFDLLLDGRVSLEPDQRYRWVR